MIYFSEDECHNSSPDGNSVVTTTQYGFTKDTYIALTDTSAAKDTSCTLDHICDSDKTMPDKSAGKIVGKLEHGKTILNDKTDR